MLELGALFIGSVHVCGACASWASCPWLGQGQQLRLKQTLEEFFLEPSEDNVGPGNSFSPIKAALGLTKFGLVEE